MQAKNEILDELRSLSAVVSGISRENPYRVPAGYFDSFPAQLVRLTHQSESEGPFFATSRFLTQTSDKPLAFSVPEGYFEGFAQNLLDKIKAGQAVPRNMGTGELERPIIAGEAPAEIGSPEGVQEEIARLSPLLSGISRKLPYMAPEGYFEELSPILPMLMEVREKPLYTVPEGYFASLAEEVLARVTPMQTEAPARVISLNRNFGARTTFRPRTLWKYAAAAVIAGLIFTVGWLRLHTPAGSHPGSSIDIASNLGKVSNQDLQSYLDNQNDQNTTAEPLNSTATLDITDSDVKSLLGDVPDGDLKEYMEEHGGPNDIATN